MHIHLLSVKKLCERNTQMNERTSDDDDELNKTLK